LAFNAPAVLDILFFMSDIIEPGFKLSVLLAEVNNTFARDEKARQEQIKRVNGVFELRAKTKEGTEGVWTIDLKKEGKVVKGPAKDKPDVIISCSDENFIDISSGKLSGQKAFMTGKLKAKGNIMFATKLESVLGAAKSKAKL